ncbi:MAG: sigma-70 family RNA polymerase sigma factor [Clostridiales bacterium]|jgi:RNA polymerase sigma-70 factor (ECF subfamily)|nr:sigma-70 family RNA polymerase sigma factor [Clostridiales bacterium]
MTGSCENLTDFEIITRCLNEDKDYFEELVNRYKNLVYSIILRMTTDNEEANDLAQEVFIKLYKNLDKYYPDYKFSTWAIRITTNHVIDHRRKKHQETASLEDAENEIYEGDSPEITAIRQEEHDQVNEAVGNLPDMYKIPILLYHHQGLSYQEISDVIEEPLSKVKNRIFRGRKMLKESLLHLKGSEVYELRQSR